ACGRLLWAWSRGRRMRFKTMILLVAAATLLGPPYSAALQPPQQADDQEQQETPCEKAAIAIAEHANSFMESANRTSDPFNRNDNVAKACGVLVRGMKQLSEMSCPQDIIQLAVDSQKETQHTLDKLNELYEYHFNCFVPEFL